MDFYNAIGKMALGSRLRRLSELITEQAAQIYALYQVDLQPKWFPVFYALAAGDEKSITAIAREIGHSHPSVSQIVREMARKGYVTEKKGKSDGRKNFVVLSAKGRALCDKIQPQYVDVSSAMKKAMKETQHDLWEAIGEWEYLLEQKSLLQRVREEKKSRESGQVQIVEYRPEHDRAFRELNEEWITRYFKMEEADYNSLDHPKEYILDKGGHIFIAIYEGEPVGTCALIPQPADSEGAAANPVRPAKPVVRASAQSRAPGSPDRQAPTVFELAKMAVSPKVQGKGIGMLLGQACIEKARELGAKKIYLESNTRLKPALGLYHKLGFQKVVGSPSPYERSNIQMELKLG